MIQGRREEKCCLQANPIMPRAFRWSLHPLGKRNNRPCQSFPIRGLKQHKKKLHRLLYMKEKVLSSFPQKDSFRAQVKFIIGEQLRTWFSSLLWSGVFLFSKTWCLICLLSLELLSHYCVKHLFGLPLLSMLAWKVWLLSCFLLNLLPNTGFAAIPACIFFQCGPSFIKLRGEIAMRYGARCRSELSRPKWLILPYFSWSTNWIALGLNPNSRKGSPILSMSLLDS